MVFYIIGYMGAGKSSVGREVAKRTGLGFVDMDREVEKLHGMPVAAIFDRDGEKVFRKSEREVLEQLAGCDEDIVVSCGGGTPCQGDNMALMNETGKTVYLKLSPEKLIKRLRPGQDKRPILKGMDSDRMLEFIRRMLPEREPHYMQASMIIDCDALSDDSICGYVADYVRHYSAGAGE